MKNKVLTLLLSLVISFGLWLYVVTVISPEYEVTVYNVPVELVGNGYLDRKELIAISETDGLHVDLTLRGNRSDLKKFNNSNITVIADLSQITHAGEHQLDCSVSFQSGSAEVVAQNPDQISVTVADKLTKTVPVEITYIGSVPDGYEAERTDVAMDHTTVTVSGPKQTIDRIASAGIVVDLTGKMTSFAADYPITLCGIDGRPIADDSFVTVNLEEIRAVVQVYKVKKVPVQFVMDFTASGLQENMVTLYPQVETVTLVGSGDDLEKVGSSLTFTIVLRNYSQASMEVFTPELPEGVQCRETINAYIQMPEMTSRWLTVSNYSLMNVSDGMNVQVSQTATVEVRGPRDILEQLTADDVLGMVDCAGLSETSAYAPVTYIVPGYEYLFVSAEWANVLITVSQPEP